jgi:hypothetical protein
MRHMCLTKPTPLIAGLLFGLLFAIVATPLNAATKPEIKPYYDITKEVTLSGPVLSVIEKPEPGMIFGSHLMVETGSGKVDASLGRWGILGKDALSVTEGEQVELTGVMKTANHKDVFVVRTVKANGKVYTLRNQHGFEISPKARERAAQKGETL